MELSREREETILGMSHTVGEISGQNVRVDPYSDSLNLTFPFENIGTYVYVPVERANEMSLKEFKDKTLNLSIVIGKSNIEDEDCLEDTSYQEINEDSWTFPDSLYTLGEERSKAQLDSFLINPIPTMKRKFRLTLYPFISSEDFDSGSSFEENPKSVVVKFQKPPSILEIIKTHCYLGSKICRDLGHEIIDDYNVWGIKIYGGEGILNVDINFEYPAFYRWED